jgi:hypothetical protein
MSSIATPEATGPKPADPDIFLGVHEQMRLLNLDAANDAATKRLVGLLEEKGFNQIAPSCEISYAYQQVLLSERTEISDVIWRSLAGALITDDVVAQKEVRYALGIEESCMSLSKSVAAWRNGMTDRIELAAKTAGVDASGDAETEYLLNAVGGEDRDAAHTTLLAVGRALRDPTIIISPEVRDFELGLPNIDLILAALDNENIDSWIRNALELVDKVRQPSRDVTSSKWQDINDLLNFYAPGLELADRGDLAEWIKDEAYQALYIGTDELRQAKRIHKKAVEDEPSVRTMLETALSEQPTNFECVLQTRPKSIGSLTHKLVHKPEYAYTSPGDAIGARVILKNEDSYGNSQAVTEEELAMFALHLNSILERSFGARNINSVTGKENAFEEYLGRETKGLGYKSVHSNLNIDGLSPVELQLVSERAHRINRTLASPLLYKASFGFSQLSIALRKIRDRDSLNPNEAVRVRDAQEKIVDLKNRNRDLSTIQLRPRSLAVLAMRPHMAESDPLVLGTVAEMDVTDIEVVIPAVALTEEKFLATLEELYPSLKNDPNVATAMSLAEMLHAGTMRKGTEVNYFEGHLLPVALAAAYKLARLSPHANKSEFASIVAASLLHDFKEDIAKIKIVTDSDKEYLTREYDELCEADGMEDLNLLVDLMTKPSDPELTKIEKDKALVDRLNRSGNWKAKFIKFYDKAHNLNSDFIKYLKMLSTRDLDQDELTRIRDFQDKCEYFFRKIDIPYLSSEKTHLLTRIQTMRNIQDADG